MKKAAAVLGLLLAFLLAVFAVRGVLKSLLTFWSANGTYDRSYAVASGVFALLVGAAVVLLVRWCIRALR